MVVFGTRLFGKVDHFDQFHVATRFFHIDFIPLVPIESFLLLSDGRGIKIPMNGKSVLFAYGRAACVVGALVSLFLAFNNGPGMFLLALVIAAGLYPLHVLQAASADRIEMLCSQAGLARRVEVPLATVAPAPPAACYRCNTALTPGASYCMGCGSPTGAPKPTTPCASCGTVGAADTRFCQICGTAAAV